MDKVFLLTVAVGTVILKSNGSRQILSSVPENAVELWENGSRTLVLKRDAAPDFLSKYSKEQLEKILQNRKHLKYAAEIKHLETAIKSAGKPKKPATDKE